MSLLPSSQTPLNRHSLQSLELWLAQVGAEQSETDPCLWNWSFPQWDVEIKLESDEIKVTWNKGGEVNHCVFSYGLLRNDLENAIREGP